ncbi:MAG: hypothetical protein M3R38_13860 [Actinomycetota bacterium]|nr:hypothetical protein [Actinomycetota bacterium]
MTAKPCRICAHAEEAFITKLLRQGLSPRALCKRIGGTTRRGLARHRDACLTTKERKDV